MFTFAIYLLISTYFLVKTFNLNLLYLCSIELYFPVILQPISSYLKFCWVAKLLHDLIYHFSFFLLLVHWLSAYFPIKFVHFLELLADFRVIVLIFYLWKPKSLFVSVWFSLKIALVQLQKFLANFWCYLFNFHFNYCYYYFYSFCWVLPFFGLKRLDCDSVINHFLSA